MGARGPHPKDDDKRLRRNAPTYPSTDLYASAVGAPPLPGAEGYLPQTVSWYEVWASSPQAAQFLKTDWQRLHMMAPLADRYFRDVTDPRPAVVRQARALLAELARLEKQLGATAEDRLRLRWRLRTQEREEEAEQRATPPAATSRNRADPRLALVAEEGR